MSENTTDSFVFTPLAPLNRPPVEVFYHIPAGDISNMPILFSFHGAERDGANYRDYWINMANDNGFMVFAPEFSIANYPGLGDNYIMSNIFDDGDNPSADTYNNQNEWTCSIVDVLFDYIKADVSGTQQKYSAWGHSAGAQFLHRFLMYLPNNNMDIAVCSNAGWYTVPENAVSYPYGILNGQLPDSDLINAFSKKLIIHLGQDDTIPSTAAGGPRNNTTVNNQQGFTRLARGQYFFETSQNTAQNRAVAFNWEKQEVPDVGHDPLLMANNALQYLLPFLLSNDNIEDNRQHIELYPNPASSEYVTITSLNTELMSVQVYNLLGKQVKNKIIQNNILKINDLSAGVYIVMITQNNTLISKKLVIK